MAGDLVTFDLGAAIRARAAEERDRIVAILAAIDELKAADVAAKDDTLSEAGEYFALERLTAAEDRLMELVTQPGYVAYQKSLLQCLSECAAGAA